eukprot:CAMPEP_0170136082 /NCGR_PEP_ID=MMETSP0033_2-20121228/2976_1 /TAXON_ID=195969 /ORGANISM="Dolichomastix tenuilepis, Strain CCMP3274" /LENGTH=44 /DNA_ID= /DNA_START= /DNA_END= /DNA_ORIENTATION=
MTATAVVEADGRVHVFGDNYRWQQSSGEQTRDEYHPHVRAGVRS